MSIITAIESFLGGILNNHAYPFVESSKDFAVWILGFPFSPEINLLIALGLLLLIAPMGVILGLKGFFFVADQYLKYSFWLYNKFEIFTERLATTDFSFRSRFPKRKHESQKVALNVALKTLKDVETI